MIVLHISTSKTWRGGEQQVLYLMKGFKELNPNDKNVLLCPDKSILFSKAEKVAGELIGFSGFTSFFFHLKKWMLKVDIIHLHDNGAHTWFYISQFFLSVNIPVILSRRVDFKPKTNYFTLNKYNHPSIKKIICVSREVKNVMGEIMDDDEKLAVVHSGIDLNIEDGSNMPGLKKEKPFTVANIAALEDHKDWETFLKTAAYLKTIRKDIAFWVIGGGKEENKLKLLAKELMIDDIVLFLGEVDNARCLLKEVDVLLFTSKMEGLGTTVLDAMVLQCPIVSTNAGGLKEIVQHRENALVCPVGDVVSLGNAVVEILDDEQLRKNLVQRALDFVKTYDYRITAQKTFAIYREFVN